MPYQFSNVVTGAEELRQTIGFPSDRAVKKQLAALDSHCRDLISRSPFVLLGTSSPSRGADVSPKGDRPGFVLVLDERTLVIPDRPGNRRADSLENIIENPQAGLLFLVPGIGETLRVNGRAKIVRDADLLSRMAVSGKTPSLGIAVEAEAVYFHCAKAVIRSSLWKHESWPAVDEFPSLGRILMDQTRPQGCTVEEVEADISKAYAERLY